MQHHAERRLERGKNNGLYRTTQTLPGKEDWIKPGILVYFHNHSKQGPPLILLPESNRSNRWTFFDRGFLVESKEFIDGLVPLLPEGYYLIEEPIYFSATEMVPAKTLLQLGYNRAAEPILFFAEFEDGGIRFPTRGAKVTTDIFAILTKVPFFVPSSTFATPGSDG